MPKAGVCAAVWAWVEVLAGADGAGAGAGDCTAGARSCCCGGAPPAEGVGLSRTTTWRECGLPMACRGPGQQASPTDSALNMPALQTVVVSTPHHVEDVPQLPTVVLQNVPCMDYLNHRRSMSDQSSVAQREM